MASAVLCNLHSPIRNHLSGRWDSNPWPSAWQADVIPLNYARGFRRLAEWCREPESNWRHRNFQSRALPTELSRLIHHTTNSYVRLLQGRQNFTRAPQDCQEISSFYSHSDFIGQSKRYDTISLAMSILNLLKTWFLAIKRYAWLAVILSAGIFSLQRSTIPPSDQAERLRAFTRHIEFNYVTWTWEAAWLKAGQLSLGTVDHIPKADQPQIVLDYIQLVAEIRRGERDLNEIYADPTIQDTDTASLDIRTQLDDLYHQRQNIAPLAEAILQNQLSTIVADLGLTLGGQPIPPVLYHVTPLPVSLVVSPRTIIERKTSESLYPGMPIDERSALEEQVDAALDVASLVVDVGGIGLYPTMVMETTSINWLAEVIAHEWIHNYLTLRPLGLSYATTPELRIINETVANLSDKEIGAALIERYYPDHVPPPPQPAEETPPSATKPETPAFDFRAEMHETRVTTDELLAAGQIEAAEAYMETRQQFFWENGYRIRKINQAYFAFYGAYADVPGGAAGAAEDPIGDAIRALRAQSPDLATFINRISWMWTLDQLLAAVR
jgi:hypothetical protein